MIKFDKIQFSDDKNDEYYFLSRYYDDSEFPIVVNGSILRLRSTIPYEQSYDKEFLNIAEAYNYAKQTLLTLDYIVKNQWEDGNKAYVIFLIERFLLQRFTKNLDLQAKLLATGTIYLEYKSDDTFYGCGTDGQGLNMYGVLLMRTRDTINHILAEKI